MLAMYYKIEKTFRFCFFFQAEDGIRDKLVTGVQTCALPISHARSGKRHETLRAQVILLAARGVPNRQIARQVGLHFNAVGKTRARFAQERLGALQDRPRSGRKPTVPAEVKRRIVTEVTQPPPGLARWSVRTMAAHQGVSKATVQRLWAKNELKPHRTKIFKLSGDPHFEAKFWDVIGLYLQPP